MPGRNGARAPDVAVVGAGIVGLAHAVEAARRGLSVAVFERDARARGASVRNFGHGYVTAQGGPGLGYARAARERWRELAAAAGFWLAECGTLLLARSPEELAVIREFAALRPAEAVVLGPEDARARAPVGPEGLLGALWTPLDCRVDPREAVPAIAAWLERAHRVRFCWGTSVAGVEPGRLETNRGAHEARLIVLAPGHDLDRLLPEVAERAEVRRCALQMLRVAAPGGRRIAPALVSGLALLRYRGFADCPSLPALRERLASERPDLVSNEVNLIVTQQPDGDLIVGDTHHYDPAPLPFQDERLDDLLLEEAARLIGSDRLDVRQRWRGVYAHSPRTEFLVSAPAPGVRAVAVTAGIGMTTALGLAPSVLDDLLAEASDN
jgi:D-hydroxyproline dehydrogenase subunit beta